jgi:hypothetical protein
MPKLPPLFTSPVEPFRFSGAVPVAHVVERIVVVLVHVPAADVVRITVRIVVHTVAERDDDVTRIEKAVAVFVRNAAVGSVVLHVEHAVAVLVVRHAALRQRKLALVESRLVREVAVVDHARIEHRDHDVGSTGGLLPCEVDAHPATPPSSSGVFGIEGSTSDDTRKSSDETSLGIVGGFVTGLNRYAW